MDYLRIYEEGGNVCTFSNFFHIPIFTCGFHFGDEYARSVSHGLSEIFDLRNVSSAQLCRNVYSYLLQVCAGDVEKEDSNVIYDQVITGLAKSEISVFALSYKHQMRGGPFGLRQRISPLDMERMASEIVDHGEASDRPTFCFWLDQILGQRQPHVERRWVDNGLLPYAVFNTIVFDYDLKERGAWLLAETLLSRGRSYTEKRRGKSVIIQRGKNEGGTDSLMRTASAICCGVIDDLRGEQSDKISILNWALETIDMSKFCENENSQVDHFTRRAYVSSPWNKYRLKSVMLNLEILVSEVVRGKSEGVITKWGHEAELLSIMIPDDLLSSCDGSFFSDGVTKVYESNLKGTFIFIQSVDRLARDVLIVVGLVQKGENNESNCVEALMAASFDQLSHKDAQDVYDRQEDYISWNPVTKFLREHGVVPYIFPMKTFTGKWLCRSALAR